MNENAAPRSSGRAYALGFSLFGFRVRVQAAFLFIAAVLGYGSGDIAGVARWVAVVFVSVLFHELGHAIVARRFGYAPWIELHGMGGLTHLDRTDETPPATWRSDLAIALAGPFFGFMLGAAVWGAARALPALSAHEVWRGVVRDLLWANIGWSILNLVPMLPWDGGLASRAVLGRLFPREGERLAYRISVGVAGLGLAFALYRMNVWIGYLAGCALLDSLRVLRLYTLEARLGAAWAAWDRGAFEAARETAETIAKQAKHPIARARAVELAVLASLALRDSAGAKAAYDTYPSNVPPTALLAGIVALDGGDRVKGAKLLRAVPPPGLRRVLPPLVSAWAKSGWGDRVADWFDDATYAALPDDLATELRASLSGLVGSAS